MVRVWLDAGGAAPVAASCARSIRGSSSRACRRRARVAAGRPQRGIYLIDPLGNLVLRYPADPDIKGLAKDLARAAAGVA